MAVVGGTALLAIVTVVILKLEVSEEEVQRFKLLGALAAASSAIVIGSRRSRPPEERVVAVLIAAAILAYALVPIAAEM